MRAIIIGAGRGARLMPTTADAPKCFAEVGGRSILDWTIHALRSNGVDDICFIGGYQIDKVRERYTQFTFRHNEGWQNNNILASLFHAEDLMDEPFLCCYSDILFTPSRPVRPSARPSFFAISTTYSVISKVDDASFLIPSTSGRSKGHSNFSIKVQEGVKAMMS